MAESRSFSLRRPYFSRANSEKLKLEHIQRLSLLLAGCQKVAEASPVPGLPLLFLIAKGIVDTVRDARSNVEDAVRLAERVCNLIEAISEQPQSLPPRPRDTAIRDPQSENNTKPPGAEGKFQPCDVEGGIKSFQLEEHVNSFSLTLEEIATSLSMVTDRVWYMAAFYVFQDKQSILDDIQKLDQAVVLFQVRGLKSLREDTTGMTHKLDQVWGSINQTLNKLEELRVKVSPPAEHRPSAMFKRLRSRGITERQRRPYVYIPAPQALNVS